MTELEPNIESFVQQAQNAYQENSILRDLGQWMEYDDEKHAGLDFVQIGRLTSIPKRIFQDSRGNLGFRNLAKDLTKPIWIGEQLAIIDEIDQVVSESKRSEEVEELTYDIFKNAFRESNADHVFIPITESYWHTVHEWYDEEKGGYRNDTEYISVGTADLEIHWLPTDRGVESIYLLDSNGLSVIQKRGKHSQIPDQITDGALEDINRLSDERHLMCYFADQGNDELDVLQRVVLWMNLDTDAGFRIDPRMNEEL